MTDADWEQLAAALRELHRTLMERGRRDYERERGLALQPGQLLKLLMTDAGFEWLRPLSELIVDMDLVRDMARQEATQEAAGIVRAAVEHFVTPPRSDEPVSPFAQRLWRYVQEEPRVAIAYAEVRKAMASWPAPASRDAAALLHERHRLAEQARHRTARPRRRAAGSARKRRL